MASAHKYRYTRKGTQGRPVTVELYRAQWIGPDGKQVGKRGFDRKGDALAYAQDREAEARHGVTLEGERPTGRTTVKEWGETWLASQDVRASSHRNYTSALNRIYATLGSRQLASLRPSELQAWRRGLDLAESTRANTATILAMMLSAAVADGLLVKSPMPPGKRGSSTGRVVDPAELLTLEQVRAWDAKLPEHARGLAIVAAATGLRQGELLGLQVEDVDFLRGQVQVRRQLLVQEKGRPYGPTKTAAGVRTVPLSTEAGEAIGRHLALYPAADGESIFRSSWGSRWSASAFHGCWSGAHKAAKLPEWATWHSLRDVAASALIRGGVDVRSVMVILGHGTAEETLRTYSRLWPDAQDVARKTLDRLWSEPAERHENATEG